ncbi:MAG: type I asparaginase [Deltaproteobacteria bacterium]|nr:MAG: type I asparaginase [Deltaproteobacteria bacterium]
MKRRKVCILHVGGTIAMVWSEQGYVPRAGYVEEYLRAMEELSRPDLPDWELVRLDPLKDSADFTPEDWVRIARAVRDRADDYDGFVILHGTDTMAYTASALSYLLVGIQKPIILTGAQLPLSEVRSDGREHLITSLILAGTVHVPEVCIYFGARLLRGNRAQKVHNASFIAFDSGNYPPLATVGVNIAVRNRLIRTPKERPVGLTNLERRPEVVAMQVFPGMTERGLRRVLEEPVEGVVLETYGAGTFPASNKRLIRAIEEAIQRGVVIVNCSQCHSGQVQQELYGTGAALARAGVVSGHDMTPEAALTKLYCLLASGATPEETRRRMVEDIAGEITLEQTVPAPPL